jgi:microsomal dipeptidase-like Zn-dependent dipeptidase
MNFIFLPYFYYLLFIHSAHINHIRDIAGIESVGLGADYDGIDSYVLLCFDLISSYINILEHRMIFKMYQHIPN